MVPGGVRAEVAASWRRSCSLSGDAPADLLLQPPTASRRVVELDVLAERLAGLVSSGAFPADGPVFLLDVEGRVVTRWNVAGSSRDADGLGRVSSLAEGVIGTSAVGLAMDVGAARQTVGAEHLLPSLTAWTSTAGPIHDRDGEPVAYLAVLEGVASATLTPALLQLVVALLELETRRAA